MAIIYVPTALFLIGVLLLAKSTGRGVGLFTRDPTAVLKGPFYAGFVSQLGVLVWCAAATSCLFASSITRREDVGAGWRPFLRYAGILTAALLVDDLFLFHEEVFPRRLGIPEVAVLGAYGIATLYFLVRFRREILASEYPLLAASFGFFAVSIAVDSVDIERLRYWIEDGFKIFGLVSWMVFFVRTSHACCATEPSPGSPQALKEV